MSLVGNLTSKVQSGKSIQMDLHAHLYTCVLKLLPDPIHVDHCQNVSSIVFEKW